MRILGLLAALLLTAAAHGQGRLVVNGRPVGGLTTTLLPGYAYAPAEPYARALRAELRVGGDTLLLSFGGRLVSLPVFPTPGAAAAAMASAATGTINALMVDGRRVFSPGAVLRGGTVYLPIKSVTAALTGRTAYLEAERTVVVVFPRPALVSVSPPGVWGRSERFVLAFDAPVSLESRFEPSLGVARFRFARAELGNENLTGQRFSGSRFSDAALVPGDGFLDFNLTLPEGNRYTVFTEPHGDGERVVIDVLRGDAPASAQTAAVVLAADARTEPLARRLQRSLEDQDVAATVVRTLPGDAAPRGFGTPLLLALRAAPVDEGRFNVFYLPEDAGVPTLAAPVRVAASGVTGDAGDRLEHLSPDFGVGERFARRLATSLAERTALTPAAILAAPLLELGGAAGRGVLLELSPSALDTPAETARLEAAIGALVVALVTAPSQGR